MQMLGGRDAQQDDKEPLPEWGAKSNSFESKGKAPGNSYAQAKSGSTPASFNDIESDTPF
jgi:hypothetical protein